MNEPIEHEPSGLLEHATTATVEAILGKAAPPAREALALMIRTNRDLIASGDTKAMASALARQATALEAGMLGLLAAMASSAATAEQRLALSKAAVTLHAACLRSFSALLQVTRGAPAPPA